MSAMSQAGVALGSGWMLARQMGSRDSASSRATRIAGPEVSITTSTPSRPELSNSCITRSASSRYLIALAGTNSSSPGTPRCAASSAAYPSCRCAIPGIMSSYRSCMMPRIPMRATVPDLLVAMTFLLNGWLVVGVQPSALAVFRGVPAVQGVDLVGRSRLRLTEHPGQVDRSGGILAHHRGLRSEEHTSELQSRGHLVCRLLLEKKKK